MEKPRDLTFDMMKGIGILLVLIGHVWSIYIPHIYHVIYSFHMPMFFMVAGYFSKSYSQGENLKIICGYVRRLVPPFVFTISLGVLFHITWALLKPNYGWSHAICNALSLFWADICRLPTAYGAVGIGVVWFLLALLWAKIVLLLLSRWEKWVLPISFALSIGALLLHKVFPYSVWCLSVGLISLPFVSIGWWVRRHKLPLWFKVVLIICWILALMFSKMDIYEYCFFNYPLDVLGACGGTYVLYWICKHINAEQIRNSWLVGWLPQLLAYLGTMSLAIMCMHNFEMDAHLGNRLRAMVGIELPVWGLYVWRYVITIILAIVMVQVPKLKKIFV